MSNPTPPPSYSSDALNPALEAAYNHFLSIMTDDQQVQSQLDYLNELQALLKALSLSKLEELLGNAAKTDQVQTENNGNDKVSATPEVK